MKAVRCREDTAGGGGERKTQPDVGALQRQVHELLDEKDKFLKNEDEYRRNITDQQPTIN